MKQKVREAIVAAGRAEQLEQLRTILEGNVKLIRCALDMAYPIRDFRSPCGFLAFMVDKKVIYTLVVKRPQKTKNAQAGISFFMNFF